MASEVEIVPRDGVTIINHTGFEPGVIAGALEKANEPIMAEMVRWARDAHSSSRRGGLIDRDRFVTPRTVMHQIDVAREAMGDDVVSGIEESTEALVFSASSMFHDDEDEQDAWNQWAEEFDLDSRLREMWYQTFSDSQCAALVLWDHRSYSMRGATEKGNKRRKSFNDLFMPVAMSVVDTRKVVPVGTMLFNRERFAYAADWEESAALDAVLGARDGTASTVPSAPVPVDDIVSQVIVSRYTPDRVEARLLVEDGIDPMRLYLIRDGCAFRHTLTRPAYKRFADVRMRTVFELLDLKAQLHQMDRAFLIGGTNFLVLVTRGTDKEPALPQEIADLRANVNVIARTPVMVGPHDLNVKIITPAQDYTLKSERYDILDKRIAARLYLQFMPTGADNADPLKLGRVVAQGLESRRLMMRRSLERQIFARAVAANRSQLTKKPTLLFHPAQISLAFDPNWASFLLDLRQSNEMSRDTLHSQFGLDQRMEATLRMREEDNGYDEVFKTVVPYGQPDPTGTGTGGDTTDQPAQDPKSAGRRQGGNRNGGGRAKPGSGQGQPARRLRRKSDGNSGPVAADDGGDQ